MARDDDEDDKDDKDQGKGKKSKKKTDKPTSLAALMSAINTDKVIGAGAIHQGRGAMVPVDVFPTKIAKIDLAFGCGGIPQGRIMELYGNESSGKTTTCLHLIKACQQHNFVKKGGRMGVAAFIDAEHAFDPVWAGKIGVDTDKLVFSQPDSGEQAFGILQHIVSSGLVDLVIIDSVAAMVPQEVLDKGMDEHTIGAQARLMSRGLSRAKGPANTNKCTVIFINQLRNKIGFVLGNPEETPGGKALKFYSSLRVEIKKGQPIRDGDTTLAFRSKIKVVKNKVAAPFGTGEFDLCVGRPERPLCGIDQTLSLLESALEYGVVSRKGSMYSYGDERIGAGQDAAIDYLNGNQKLWDKIMEETYATAIGEIPKITVEDPEEVHEGSEPQIIEDDDA